jgi:hypothetical protein
MNRRGIGDTAAKPKTQKQKNQFFHDGIPIKDQSLIVMGLTIPMGNRSLHQDVAKVFLCNGTI